MNKKNKVTLKSISEHLNISVTTVSRALAGYNDVNPQTRERIQQAADELGYVPNLAARRLVTGKSNAIGILLPVPYGDMRDHFLSHFLMHFGQALYAHNPALDLIISYAPEGEEELVTYKRFIDSQRVDAFVVLRTRKFDPRVELLKSRGVPFVTHGRTQDADTHNWIDTDASAGFGEATQSLINKGHKKISLLNLPERFYTAKLRVAGYEEAMSKAGLSSDIHTMEIVEKDAFNLATSLLKSATPPTGFVCASDVIAFQVVKAAKKLGLDPSKDIQVIGCDDLPLSQIGEPSISTLKTSMDDHSQSIISILQTELNGHVVVPRHKLIKYKLVERDTSCLDFVSSNLL
ncbi:LacI family DNA-binding transcriptional regulator [Marinomonas epiphytica]